MVFFGSDGGKIIGLDLSTGKRVWQFDTGATITGSPAIGYQRLVIGTTDGAIYCFG
jgi:outer membrane protein assembly factor BamB